MEPGVLFRISKGSPVIPILSRSNPIPRIGAYFCKVDSNICYLLKVYYAIVSPDHEFGIETILKEIKRVKST